MKNLAVLGGKPAFDTPLHVGCPNTGDRDQFLEYASAIFDSRWLTNCGPFVKEFEERLGNFLGVKHCLTICNATIALEIAIRAMDLGGEVIVPAFTFVATAHALQWVGVTPVFCDVDPMTHNLDPACVEKLITPRTTGIMGVHVWGRPCAIEALQEIAHARNLKLLYDAAHAFGCTYQGRRIGNFGHAEVLSFHATKFFNTFEGGAIVTNDDDLAARIRLMRNFGFAGYDQVQCAGTNGKMSEVSAAMGLTNLKALESFIEANCRNYHHYRQQIATLPGLSLIDYDEREECNYQYMVIEVDSQATGLHRDDLLRVLHAENVLARRYFWPGCHRMEPYRSLYPEAGQRLPCTEQLAERVVVLPTGTAVGERDVACVCEILRTAIAQADQLHGKARLS